MPSAPQPRKKSISKPQDGTPPSCGHSGFRANCAVCRAEAEQQKQEMAAEKQRLLLIREKISHKLTDEAAVVKAALILARWIRSGKTSSK